VNRLLSIALLVISCVSSPRLGLAALICKEIPYDSFGHLWNNDDGTMGGVPVGWCAATSIANSFQYLADSYPDTHSDLIQGTLVETRNMLNNGWLGPGDTPRPGVMGCPGTLEQPMWEAKYDWIQDYAPKTRVKGMIGGEQNPSSWRGRENLEHAFPTWEWLFQEICDKEDVEIVIRDFRPFGSAQLVHAMTLTRICFNDMDGDMTLDPATEMPQIGFIDPNQPDVLSMAGLDPTSFEFGPLRFNYNDNGTIVPVHIRSAMSESPVPEPITVVLLITGAWGLMICRSFRFSRG
jgi:hypothetical protein